MAEITLAVKCIELGKARDEARADRDKLLLAFEPLARELERLRQTVRAYDRVINFDLTPEERVRFSNALVDRMNED